MSVVDGGEPAKWGFTEGNGSSDALLKAYDLFPIGILLKKEKSKWVTH